MSLIPPYGGSLVDLVEPEESRSTLIERAASLPSLRLSERSRCDLELLANGAFSPLRRFMGRRDYESVVAGMRLADGTLFPIPITLPIPDDFRVDEAREVALRGPRNDLLAVMTIEEVFEWDRQRAAECVFGTRDTTHPLVAEMASWGRRFVSGPLRAAGATSAADFRELRRSPSEVRSLLASLGRRNVVAFQTRNPLHRAHEELVKRAIEPVDGTLLLHPAVGMTRPGDVDQYTRIRTYRVVAEKYLPRERVVLSLLPLAMRMAGPREALWHAIIRRNFGANFFIIGRDHASPGLDSSGRPFYGLYDAQNLAAKYESETGVRILPFREMVYVDELGRYEEESSVPPGTTRRSISGTQLREAMERGEPLPEWFARPEVSAILSSTRSHSGSRGFCVWFTGLSAAGKSTTAELLVARILERGRPVTLLDGDIVRTHLSKGLGFSREDRDTNILRIGFVASEIVRHGGAVVCAAVSPYRATRDRVRAMVGSDQFIEVFVDTPIEVCEARDPKGMYNAARKGTLRNFTGVDDPYEPPLNPALRLETVAATAESNACAIVRYLTDRGFFDSR